jgi:GntP family gluconate:H+ symporter
MSPRPVPNSKVEYSMSGMPFFQALALLASVIVIIVATHWRKLHPFLAIMVIASAFGLAVGFSTGFLGKAFGAGFSLAIYSPGLVIVAASFVAGVAESTAASEWLTTKIDHWRWLGPTSLATLLGLIAGIGASPASAFALLTPLLRAVRGGAAPNGKATMVASALAISASHGLLLVSPVLIAAASILNAGWGHLALFGLPLALLLVACGAAWARWLSVVGASPHPSIEEQHSILPKRSGWSAIVLVLATAIPLMMLMIQSLGDIPSEPFGGGPTREMVLGVGRPLVLFLVGLGIMVIGLWRLSVKLFADSTWTGHILGNVSSLLLMVGAAGGLQRLCQETGMAELLGERLLEWHVGGPGALLIPFLIAAVIKTLQGSSLVAAITTAGMVHPILAPLGIGDESAKALATLAIGVGAMTVSHVNDEYFWLVTGSGGLSPLRGLALVTVGTLLQGLIAVAALLVLSVLVSGF